MRFLKDLHDAVGPVLEAATSAALRPSEPRERSYASSGLRP